MPEPAHHVLLIEPVDLRFNPETEASNVFQSAPPPGEAARLSSLAVEQHRVLRDLLTAHGVAVTIARSLPESPDAAFCNNWFSTHPADDRGPSTLVLYPLLAPNRRTERREDLIALLRPGYGRVVDLSPREQQGRYLESTGSLVVDQASRTAYAVLSPRTDRGIAEEWSREMGFDLVAFRAEDANGIPYYHTNVVMFLGHGIAGIALETISSPAERRAVESALRAGGHTILPLTRTQLGEFCGNCLALTSLGGDPLLVMSTRAHDAFTDDQRSLLASRATLLRTDLSAFEQLGGGSARCLIAELY
ncbi:MAG: arginine deiminase-related protein [Gemmatimonadales bacterium]